MKTISIVIFLMLFYSTASAENYKWVDNRGVINFTDNPLNVPSEILKASRFEFAELKPKTEASIALLLAILKIQHNNSLLWDRSIVQVYDYEHKNNQLIATERMFNQKLNSNLKELQNRVVELETEITYTKKHKPIFVSTGHHGHSPHK